MARPPFYPASPPKGALRLDRLLFIRKNHVYVLAWLVALTIVCAVIGFLSSPFMVVFFVGIFLIELLGLATVSLQIRAQRRAG